MTRHMTGPREERLAEPLKLKAILGPVLLGLAVAFLVRASSARRAY
jgi:hypothetical protein